MRKPVVRSFVVRVYRATPNRPDHLYGEAEEVGKKKIKSFSNLEELWTIVNPLSGKKQGMSSKEAMPGESPPGGTSKNDPKAADHEKVR